MTIDRSRMYHFPWSRSDNPGGWVEVTDRCDLACPGCYRHRLEGDRPVEDVERDILSLRSLTKCGRIYIAGGEPLIYPHLAEVVTFVAEHGMEPVVFTNGEKLDRSTAGALKKAGLNQFFIHVDGGQRRPGWEGRSEAGMNPLRQRYADLIAELGGVRCGFNMTVTRENLGELPDVLHWATENIDRVQNLSFIALRGMDRSGGKRYAANGRPIDASRWLSGSSDARELTLTTDEIYEVMISHMPSLRAAAYLGGTSRPETTKFLIILPLGSPGRNYGVVGARTVELQTAVHHWMAGNYAAKTKGARIGKAVFALSLFDGEVRKALGRFIGAAAKDPRRLLEPVYLQSINIQQPNEIIGGETNLCEGCYNQMVYRGRLIPECQLDEFRLFGGPIHEMEAGPGSQEVKA